jgi:zinc/manganese transport system permease protein
MWEVMFWPSVACVLLPWLLVYLGIHVVQRGIIFIDIAMAQMASLGICVAVLLHMDLESPATFAIALGFTLSVRLSFLHRKTKRPGPPEAVIGIACRRDGRAVCLNGQRKATKIKNILVSILR